jgi:hypothetical protein
MMLAAPIATSPEASLHLLRHAQVGQRHATQTNVDAPACNIPVVQRCHFHFLNKATQQARAGEVNIVELPSSAKTIQGVALCSACMQTASSQTGVNSSSTVKHYY